MQSAREFHCFSKLPQEIQLLVWDAWREHVPTVRHYFVLELNGRGYAAFNCTSKSWIQIAARTAKPALDDPMDPLEHKILFTNKISFASPKPNSPAPDTWDLTYALLSLRPRINEILDGNYFSDQGNTLRPAYAWVNFRKDVFFVDTIGYRLPGRLRFLFYDIGNRLPQLFGINHWATKIQKLAFYINGPRQSKLYGLWDEIDINALAKMRLLKQIFLVFQCSGCSVEYQYRADSHGFVHDITNNEKHLPGAIVVDEYSGVTNLCQMPPASAQQQKAEMASLLAKAGMSTVKVEVVADVGCV